MDTAVNSPLSAEAHFDAWSRRRELQPVAGDRLSLKSAALYRYVWAAWITFLKGYGPGSLGTHWLEANAMAVDRFLRDAVSPSSARKSRTTPISPVTRQRYLRLLSWIYQDAVNVGIASFNPARAILDGALPLGDVDGQVFNRVQWQWIRQAFPDGLDRWSLRDRAILLLLTEQGLTTGEVCCLDVNCAKLAIKPPLLELNGPRQAQQRTLYLGDEESSVLRQWVSERSAIAVRRQEYSQALFVTKKGYPMSPRALFHLAAKTITRAFVANGAEVPNHIGPASLRNTRIVMWLNDGVPLDKVLTMSGYKDFRSLRCLRSHVHSPQATLPPSV